MRADSLFFFFPRGSQIEVFLFLSRDRERAHGIWPELGRESALLIISRLECKLLARILSCYMITRVIMAVF